MSHCTECGKPMDRIEAQMYEACRDCRSRSCRPRRVRNLNDQWSEHVGRHARDSKALGGSAEMRDLGE
jgi:DNA-directed RNA polymerase subunit RPC12/RpoP